jgi:hypothetical protein
MTQGSQTSGEGIELCVRESPINVAVALGEIPWNIVSPEQHFQCSSSTDEARETGHGAATGHQASTYLALL